MMHTDESVARHLALVRRQGHPRSVITAGKLTVNLDSKTVKADGRRVHVTRKEYEVLELLSLRLGGTVTKKAFMDHLYGGMNEPKPNPKPKIIQIFICKLRKKLAAAAGGDRCIETVWGRGYVLRDRRRGEGPTAWPQRSGEEILRSGHL